MPDTTHPATAVIPEALILGGGLAGSALAILLARAGRPITLIEQHAHPHHKVCGEFLSHEALHYLHHLCLDPIALGAVPITHLRLASGTTLARARLPFPAQSLTRKALDEALLTQAAKAGAHLVRGHRIESLALTNKDNASRGSLWQATLADGQHLRAPHAFLATGKHDLRGHPRPPGRQNNLIAFKQYFHLHPHRATDLASHVELHLFPGGYAGLQLVEPETLTTPPNAPPTETADITPEPDRVPHVPPLGRGFLPAPNPPSAKLTSPPRANLCLLIDREAYRTLGATWPSLIAHMERHAPHLAHRLADATPLLHRPLALSNIPYGLLRLYPDPIDNEYLWTLGDQTAVIPSFSGDGMSIALHTAHLAADLYLNGGKPVDLSVILHETLRKQVTLATRISRALVSPYPQPLIRAAALLFPQLLPRLATATRIATPALLQESSNYI
jgi:hypothetical protein